MKQIPNLFTLLNLFLGCIAIVLALQTQSIIIYTNDDFTSSFNIPENISLAALLLFFAALVDFLDGFVARMFKATSEMGKQLDSLADVVSFGVAPGVIIYQLLRMSYAQEENGLNVSFLLLLPAFVLSCAAAYRLAKFNLDDTQQYGFKGVPTPAVGLLIASFPLILHFGTISIFGFEFNVNEWVVNKWVLYGLIVVLSWLMVSNIPLLSFKFKNFSIKDNLPRFILIGIALLSVLLVKWLAIPVVFIAYIVLSLTFKNNATT
jgi:CDP-diacylglycerol---serine O-phosphatidyltransferase